MRSIGLTLTGLAALAVAGCAATMDDATTSTQTSSATTSTTESTGTVVTVGGADMLASRTIVENAANSPIHTTLVSAVTAAGLASTLSGAGPFTVFAPTNDAFGLQAPGVVDGLLKPENRAQLTSVLTYHVVPGRVTAAELTRLIAAGGGSAQVTTVQGGTLTATLEGGNVKLTGKNGSSAFVTQADVGASNGVVHVVNGVLLP